MKVGFVGLGKLGLPCALAIEDKGHEVAGFDPNKDIAGYLRDRKIPYREEGAGVLLDCTDIKFHDKLSDLVGWADILFVAVQTPHDPRYEGITRIPNDRIDFDYSHLRKAVQDISEILKNINQDKIVIVISTVLPGTVERVLRPVMNKHVKLSYNPFFIAMGTTINDFLNPEFVLFGVDDLEAAATAHKFYCTIHNSPFVRLTIEEAELVKVAYNTFIGTKITFVNALMEICHKMKNINVDNVTDALKMATSRLISTNYLSAGMGDGGGCHPRDNIALSWLARKLDLSHDIFDNLMMAREHQAEWLADLCVAQLNEKKLNEIVILGKAFKPETNLTVGSPSILLRNILKSRLTVKISMYDPHIDGNGPLFSEPCLVFIGTRHQEFRKATTFFPGSVVIDPFRYVEPQDGIEIIQVGIS